MRTTKILLALLLLALQVTGARAVEAIRMEGMSVTGNKESPNLLYIVPWKSSGLPDLEESLLAPTLFEDALQPIDRDVFLREELYRDAHRDLYGE